VHGTPEHVFENTIDEAKDNGYNVGVSAMHHQRGMQNADAIFTFWSRHRDLYDLATDKHTIVDLIPMGIDHAYWQAGESKGKYLGAPSVFNCENQHAFKWGYYILRMWPWIQREVETAVLHIANIPTNAQRFVDVMCARYGSIYGSVVGSWSYDHNNLRNIFKSLDYYISPVRYGDHNRTSMEAGAAGLKVISYPGNPYADFWMQEGDDRYQARDLIAILKGDVAPLEKAPIPTEQEMAHATVNVYERILDRPQTNFALGEIPDAISADQREALKSVEGRPRPTVRSAAEILAEKLATAQAEAKAVSVKPKRKPKAKKVVLKGWKTAKRRATR
jgi:hypothetical protein